MKKCAICEKINIIDVDDILSELDGYTFVIKGKRCMQCGEEFIDEQEGQKIIHTAQKFGVWGEPLKLHRKLSRSARGTMLRIPTDIEENLNLKGDEQVAISKIGKNKILIEVESS